MSFLDAFLASLHALRLNGMRSLLTTLGIIIGIASVIVMAAIGNGARATVEKQIDALGSSMLSVFPNNSNSGGRASGRFEPFSEKTITFIREQQPEIVAVSGEVRASNVTMIYEGENWSTSVTGTHASMSLVRNWNTSLGDFFTDDDVNSGRRVAVIGDTIFKELFDGRDAIGAQIRLNNVPFEVIGVMEPYASSRFGGDPDDVVFAPVTTTRSRLASGSSNWGPDYLFSMYVLFPKDENMDDATEGLSESLREFRKLPADQADNFRVLSFASFVRARNETSQTFALLLAATAAISLIVGGIGIMNIMLVSVTERTREIGLRMAVGARGQDIMIQFLIESIVLCVMGGLIGLGLGLGGAYAIAHFADWDVLIDPSLAAIAISASFGVGLFFGFFPARSAAKLNPIEALRYE